MGKVFESIRWRYASDGKTVRGREIHLRFSCMKSPEFGVSFPSPSYILDTSGFGQPFDT
jgi:hypothetical protein